MSIKEGDLIKRHYRDQAKKYGASPQSTMEDEVVRQKEIEFILKYLAVPKNEQTNKILKILDLGCGNGYTLSVLSKAYPNNYYYGIDYSADLLSIAKNRKLKRCKLLEGDVRSLTFEGDYFDLIYTERCLINILSCEEQKLALREINRILKPGGHYIMIECFTDGLLNNNKARRECGLDELKEAYHNKYFDKDLLFREINNIFVVAGGDDPDARYDGADFPNNFLSSHYFITRILHPLVTKGEWVKNTEFVKYFSFLQPYGNYSPVQAYILKKR